MSTDTASPSQSLASYVIGEILALMGRRRMNNTELGRRLGVPDYWVGRRLNGRIPMDLNDVQRIAAALGVPATDLFPQSKTNTLRKTATPLGERVVATVGEDRKARTRPHRPGRPVRQTRPVDQMTRPATRVAAGR